MEVILQVPALSSVSFHEIPGRVNKAGEYLYKNIMLGARCRYVDVADVW